MADVADAPINKKSPPAEAKSADAKDPVKDHPSSQASTDKIAITPLPDKTQLQTQRDASAAAGNTPEATKQLLDKKEIPQVSLENGLKPTDETQAQFMNFIQERLTQKEVLASITPAEKPLPGETPAQYAAREQQMLDTKQKAIQDEMNPKPPGTPTWGAASQEAFRDYLNWIQQKVVPGAIGSLVSAGLPEPGGNPLPVPEGMSAQEYETKVVTNQLKLDFGIDFHKIPRPEDAQRLENALIWANKASDVVQTQQLALQDKQINATIDSMGFPPNWHLKPGASPADAQDGRNSAVAMIDLFSKIKRAVDVIDSNKIPMELPAGVQVTRGPDGKIINMKLSMPQDLRQADPTNARIIEQSRKWLEEADKKIANALKDKNLPTLAYTDTVIPQVFDQDGNKISRQVRLDDNGNLRDLINPSTLPANERVLKEQVPARIKATADTVDKAVNALPADLKTGWTELGSRRNGSYSDSQLDFLKSNTNEATYLAAQEHNTAIEKPGGYVKNAFDVNLLEERYTTNMVPKGQVPERIKQTGDTVSKAVGDLAADKKTAYSNIKAMSDGSYSAEQLAFLKANTSKDTYTAAMEHNMAITSPDGYISVAQHVQAQTVPFFSPQNLIYTNIGNPMTLDVRFYKPDDLVGVKDGAGTEFVSAKDLPSLQDTQKVSFYGQKAMMLGMDAAMIAMGGVEITAAIEGAVALGTAAEVMSAARLGMTIAKGTLDLGLGVTDPISNGYWMSRDNGNAAMVRNYMFLGSMAWGLGAAGLAKLNPTLALSQAEAAQGVGNLISRADAITKTADQVSKAVMTWGQLPMAAQMSLGVADQLINFNNATPTAGVAADAVSQYKGPGDNQKPANEGLKGSELMQTPAQMQQALDAYKATLLQNTGDAAAKTQISNIFDTASKLMATGTDAQKQAFMQKLAANLEFNGTDLGRMEQMNGSKLTQDQIKQLMDPAQRASYPNEYIRDYAESVMKTRDANVTLASEMALLAMARGKDGKLAEKAVSTSTDVDAYMSRHRMTVTNMFGETSSAETMGPVVVGEKQNIDIDSKYLMTALKGSLGRSDIGSSAFAVGDELVKSGGITAKSYGAVLQDVLNDPKTSDADKMRMLTSNNAVSFGEVLLALNKQEKQTADSIRAGTQTADTTGKNFGTTSADLQRTLEATAANSKNPDLKAMAAALLFAAKRSTDNREEGAAIMDGVNAMYQQFQKGGAKSGDFAKLAMTAIKSQLTESDKTDVQTRLDAASAMLAANTSIDAATSKQIATALAESFSSANTAQKSQIISELLPDRLKQLAQDNPKLATQIRAGALEMLSVPLNRFDFKQQEVAVDMMKKMPQILDGADQITKNAFEQQIENILGSLMPAAYSDLKTTSIQTVAKLGSQDLVPLLRDVAGNDKDGTVRATAFQALAKIPDPNLGDLVNSRIGKDVDVRVEKILADIKYSLDSVKGTASPADVQAQQSKITDLNKFIADMNLRYPQLATFDTTAQTKWIQDTFPLLNHANFIKQAQLTTKENPPGFFTMPHTAANDAINELAKQRDDQYAQLIALATLDPGKINGSSAQGLQDLQVKARMVLASIIASNGAMISPASATIWAIPPGFRRSGLTYNETASDWAGQAAAAFVNMAQAGGSERDLATRLIGMTLASKPTGVAKASLLEAWKTINQPIDGVTPIPASIYDYVSSLS